MPIKKLRNGPTIQVDEAIIRWRKRLRQKGITLGSAMSKAKRTNKKQNQDKALDREVKAMKKNFFGADD